MKLTFSNELQHGVSCLSLEGNGNSTHNPQVFPLRRIQLRQSQKIMATLFFADQENKNKNIFGGHLIDFVVCFGAENIVVSGK